MDKVFSDFAEAHLLMAKAPKVGYEFMKGTPIKEITKKNDKWCKEVDEFCDRVNKEYGSR